MPGWTRKQGYYQKDRSSPCVTVIRHKVDGQVMEIRLPITVMQKLLKQAAANGRSVAGPLVAVRIKPEK